MEDSLEDIRNLQSEKEQYENTIASLKEQMTTGIKNEQDIINTMHQEETNNLKNQITELTSNLNIATLKHVKLEEINTNQSNELIKLNQQID